MSAGTILELAAAVALIVGGVWLYRRRAADGAQYGSQSAVLLLVLGAILAIHGLDLLAYRPSASELGQ